MSDFDDRPNRIPWPPIILVAAIAVSLLINQFLPSGWLPSPFSDILFGLGWLTIGVAILLDVLTMRTLRQAKTTIMPTKRSSHLVMTGPFAISRNPIYVANVMIVFGLGLVTQIVWFIPIAIFAGWLTQKLAIEREEEHLAHHFGKRYRDYMKKVRRWF